MNIELKLIKFLTTLKGLVILIAAFFLLDRFSNQETLAQLFNWVQILLPLGFAIHSSFLMANEVDLRAEVVLLCPTPLPVIFLRRYLLCFLQWILITAAVQLCYYFFLPAIYTGFPLMEWFSLSVFLSGMAVVCAIGMNHSIFGFLIPATYWICLKIWGSQLFNELPQLQPLDLWLDPNMVGFEYYFSSRLILTVIGLFFLGSTVITLTREQRYLT